MENRIRRSQPSARVRWFCRELLPLPRNFFERELGRLSRADHKGWSWAHCCFHRPDKHPSLHVNINSGGFYCFSCGARGGDIVAFTMLRYGYCFIVAAQSLGALVNMSEDQRRKVNSQALELQKERERLEHSKKSKHARLIALRGELYFLEHLSQQVSDRLNQLLQGAPESYLDETEKHWSILSLAHEDMRLTGAEYMMLAGLVPA